ncbi:Kanadaptin [Phytophthora citrophthora]|uniref:Kanadaptin n=1 Tax=Phytophthora citrophthora TaxID=4793 RepID=A0AAD9G246_9STRA|nr:Kanadaptin [Phytophthora citrophthora]
MANYVVVGRMETVCDLTLAHPSISRVHAALQFDEQGALFLYDLHSTHGCFVNKKRTLSEEFVRLHIGDVLVFGESTRLYAVCGPPELLPAEYESLNLAKFREKLDKKREILEKKKEEEDRGASWGFGEDAAEEESDEEDQGDSKEEQEGLPEYLRNLKEDNEPYKSSVSQTQVNERDQRLYQQLQTRIRKMENLKLEKSRILAKQNQLDGLSEGQQRTLERNEQRIDALMKEIDDLERRIHSKNDQRTKTSGNAGALRKKRNINEELYGYSSDEDDFYDRTKANQQKIAARKQKVTGGSTEATVVSSARLPKSEVLTAESIQEKVKKLEDELTKVEKDLAAASARVSTEEETKKEEEVDSLDTFMAATTTQLHTSEVDTLTQRKADIESELKRQGHLLAVATPALAALPVQNPVEKSNKTSSSGEKESPVQVQAPSVSEPEKPKTEMQPKRKGPVFGSNETSVETKPPNKPKARPVTSQMQKSADHSNSPKRRRVSGPAMGPPRQMKPTSGLQEDSSVLEGGDQVWVPPSNQTGDGRTKLNDKYGY